MYSVFGPDWLCRVVLVLFIALILFEAGERVDPWLAAESFGLAVTNFMLLMVAFWIGITRPGSPTIDGLQGRYFMLFDLLAAFALLTFGRPPKVPALIKDVTLAIAVAVNVATLVWCAQRTNALQFA